MKKILLGCLIISTLLVQGCGTSQSKASRLESLVLTDKLTSTNNKLSPEQKIENDIERATSMRGHHVTILPPIQFR